MLFVIGIHVILVIPNFKHIIHASRETLESKELPEIIEMSHLRRGTLPGKQIYDLMDDIPVKQLKAYRA